MPLPTARAHLSFPHTYKTATEGVLPGYNSLSWTPPPPLFPALPIPLTYPSLEKATDTKEVCKFTSLTPFALQRDPLTEDPLSRLSHTGYKTVWISAGKCRSVQIVYRLCLNMYHTCFWVEQRLIDSLSLSCRFFESRSHSQTYIYIISGMVGQVPII